MLQLYITVICYSYTLQLYVTVICYSYMLQLYVTVINIKCRIRDSNLRNVRIYVRYVTFYRSTIYVENNALILIYILYALYAR